VRSRSPAVGQTLIRVQGLSTRRPAHAGRQDVTRVRAVEVGRSGLPLGSGRARRRDRPRRAGVRSARRLRGICRFAVGFPPGARSVDQRTVLVATGRRARRRACDRDARTGHRRVGSRGGPRDDQRGLGRRCGIACCRRGIGRPRGHGGGRSVGCGGGRGRRRSRDSGHCGGSHGRRRRIGSRRRRAVPRGEIEQRIEVAVRVVGGAHPEMHVRPRDLGIARGADAADDRSLRDGVVLRDRDRAEMRERHGEAVRRDDRDGPAGARDRAGERHRPRCRGAHRLRCTTRDVDAAVLAGRVRMRVVEAEALDDGTVRRPGPGPRDGGREKRGHDRGEKQATHRHHPLLSVERTCVPTVGRVVRCCQTRLQSCHKVPR
jgi:hypothetical protein